MEHIASAGGVHHAGHRKGRQVLQGLATALPQQAPRALGEHRYLGTGGQRGGQAVGHRRAMPGGQAGAGEHRPAGQAHQALQIGQRRRVGVQQGQQAAAAGLAQGGLGPARAARVGQQGIGAGQAAGVQVGRAGQRVAPVVDDGALALAVDDDGRHRAARTRHPLQAARVHPFAGQVAGKHGGGVVVAHRGQQPGLRAQPGGGHQGIAGHAAHAGLVVVGGGLEAQGGRHGHAEQVVDGHMAHAHQAAGLAALSHRVPAAA